VAVGRCAGVLRFFGEGYARLLYGASQDSQASSFGWRLGIQYDMDSGMTIRRAGTFSSLETAD
jgi:hypothetical protein